MASLSLTKLNDSLSHSDYGLMRDKVVSLFKEFDAIFSMYKGAFDIVLDKKQPQALYTPAPDEYYDRLLLDTHLLFLRNKLHEIADSI